MNNEINISQQNKHNGIRCTFYGIYLVNNRPVSQIPQCICPILCITSYWSRIVHISVPKWCFVGYGTGAPWDWSKRCHSAILQTFLYKFSRPTSPLHNICLNGLDLEFLSLVTTPFKIRRKLIEFFLSCENISRKQSVAANFMLSPLWPRV